VTKPVASCTPKTATITWDQATRSDDALIGVYRLTWSKSQSIWLSQFSPIDVRPAFDDATLSSELGATPDLTMAWEQALLVDARRTGQVGTDFGGAARVDDPDRPPVVPSNPAPGVIIDAVDVNQMTMPFTITCSTGKKAIGSVTGAILGGFATTSYECGDKRYRDQPSQKYCADPPS
jgi:hypothetical protein